MIAIIPARGGSKGLPGKNIKNLNGRPLIAYTIEAALQSACITEVILSTEDKNIELIATQFGAKSPFLRPPELATDDAIATDTYIYTIDALEKMRKTSIDAFMVLQPTSPLRIAQDIDKASQLFHSQNADSVISYTEEIHPISWHKYLEEDGRFLNIFDDKMVNRQSLRKSYYPNGAIYIFKTSFIRKRQFYSSNSFAYLMPRERSVDIDTNDDFRFAEYLMGNVV
jgi:CMP-N,N'-diacetyllegionaminic acid synthase